MASHFSSSSRTINPSVYLSSHLSINPFTTLNILPSTHPSIHLSIIHSSASIQHPIHQFIPLSIYSYTPPTFYPPTDLSHVKWSSSLSLRPPSLIYPSFTFTHPSFNSSMFVFIYSTVPSAPFLDWQTEWVATRFIVVRLASHGSPGETWNCSSGLNREGETSRTSHTSDAVVLATNKTFRPAECNNLL